MGSSSQACGEGKAECDYGGVQPTKSATETNDHSAKDDTTECVHIQSLSYQVTYQVKNCHLLWPRNTLLFYCDLCTKIQRVGALITRKSYFHKSHPVGMRQL